MSKKILILDDEVDILEALKRKLERSGYIVTAVINGQEGLNAVHKERFDLVITDVVMPVMDGFRFYKELRKIPSYSAVPVIAVTAHGSMEDTFRVYGVQEFLIKPVDGDVMLKIIGRLLDPSAKNQFHRTVLVLGSDMDVVSGMVNLLNDQGHKASAARDEADFIVKTLTVQPDIVLVDVLLPMLLAHELIKSLRCFSHLNRVAILAYTHFHESELNNVDAVEQLKDAKNHCMASGATAYIGRFSRLTFMDVISKY